MNTWHCTWGEIETWHVRLICSMIEIIQKWTIYAVGYLDSFELVEMCATIGILNHAIFGVAILFNSSIIVFEVSKFIAKIFVLYAMNFVNLMEYTITSKLGNGQVGHSRHFECFKIGTVNGIWVFNALDIPFKKVTKLHHWNLDAYI